MIKNISRSSNYKWVVFGAVGLGSITNVTDHGGVAIALLTIAQDLAFTIDHRPMGRPRRVAIDKRDAVAYG